MARYSTWLAVAGTLAALAMTACASSTVQVAWTVSFETPTLAARAVRVETTLHDGPDCTGSTRYAASALHGSDPTPAPPAVPFGTYTLCVDAVDDACSVFASGSTTVTFDATTSLVAVLVRPTAATPACPGSACEHGECVLADGGALPDAGSSPDTGMPPDADVADMPPPMMDAGCMTNIVNPPTAAACQDSTGMCIFMCSDVPCENACIAADPFPAACEACISSAFNSCENAHGCQDEWDAAMCCSASCPDPMATSCCPHEWGVYDACAMALGTACDFVDGPCYP